MEQQHGKNNITPSSSTGTPDSGGRWGTWVMGVPATPQTHPVNQQAATWVAGESMPPPSTTTMNTDYMKYSGPPVADNVYYNPPPQTKNPYVQTSTVPGSSGKSPMEMILNVLSRWGKMFDEAAKKAEDYAGNVWQHLKTSPSLTDAAMARLAQGTKVLTEGGQEKIFQQTFGTLPGEKLHKAYACYLSTSSGPVIGTLYLSNMRLAFCSDNPLCYMPAPGHQEWSYYKLVVPFDRLREVNPSANRLNPTEKYIQIITADGHEFWFMGFVSYDKALKNLKEALQHQLAGGASDTGNSHA